jgi:HEPN/RES N-terminal domain 1/RES domain
MGYFKDSDEEERLQGWSYSKRNICAKCLDDPHLRGVVKASAVHHKCDFCGRKGKKKPVAAPFNTVMKPIADAVFEYWNHAEDEPIAWDQEDYKYVGTTYDTYDLVHAVIPAPSEDSDVMDHIADLFEDHTWCEKSPYAVTGTERHSISWEQFCRTVKYQVRYFFESVESERFYEGIPVPQMLDELRDIIENAGLLTTLPEGTLFYRIRIHKPTLTCNSWDSLGPPPPERCPSNRMSAAGISVFYAGMDLATAKAETSANLKSSDTQVFTAGTWTNTRPINVLDLSKLPPIPGFYAGLRYERDQLAFLHEFVDEIRKPVSHDGREHIDYVPTQILTEYFRHPYKVSESGTLDGIIYKSAQRPNGRSIILFASHDDLDPNKDGSDAKPILKLEPSSIKRLRPRKP